MEDLLCDGLECMVIYIFVNVELPIIIQAARVALCFHYRALLVNGKEVNASEHGVEMDDRG